MEIGQDHLRFHDLKVSVSGNKLMTTIYSKTTDRQSFVSLLYIMS